jgi:hypothetical protein
MSYQNDSHKGGQSPKGKVAPKTKGSTIKGTGTIKGSGTTKGVSHAKTGGKGFHASDIKSLVHNQGRAKLGGQEWALKAPSWSDSTLQAIISDPKLTARPTGNPAVEGRFTYELCGHGKTINVTIGR